MRSWYAVYTHTREELLAQENLARQGFEIYWPRYRKRVSHARRVQEAPASLFPRYLFAAFDPVETGWRSIRSTRGVVSIVTQGYDPVRISERLIADIRTREDLEGFVVLGRQIELQKGQRIQLKGNALSACNVIFEAKKDSERVVALLTLLGRQFTVDVPVAQIMPAH